MCMSLSSRGAGWALMVQSETMKLRYPATVVILDDAGKQVGTKTLKAGTEIEVREQTSDQSIQAPSEVSPAQFLIEKPTTPKTFLAEIRLDGAQRYLHDFDNKFWRADSLVVEIKAYGKTRDAREGFYGYVRKKSPIGKSIYELIKDGIPHVVYISFHVRANCKNPYGEIIDNMQPVPGKKSVYDILPK